MEKIIVLIKIKLLFKNIIDVIKLNNRSIPYSIMKIEANNPPPYSILKPETISDSPSDKSKGVRLDSAIHKVIHKKKIGVIDTIKGRFSCIIFKVLKEKLFDI